STPDNVEFKLHYTGHKDLAINLSGSLGIPGLDLQVDSGKFILSSDYNFQFNFGVSKADGFYVDTGTSSLGITFSATIPDLKATGHLFFLKVDVNQQPGAIQPIVLAGSPNRPTLEVDLVNPVSPGSPRLTLQELTSGNFSPADLFAAKLNLETHIPLHLKVSFNGNRAIPSIETDFHLDWNFLNADTKAGTLDFGGVPNIGFRNVTLDLGSFIDQFIT